MTIQEKIAKLRGIAERATPGPWNFERIAFEDGEFAYERNNDGGLISLHESNYEQPMKAKFDSDHIAAFNPAQVLALLEALETLVEAIRVLNLDCYPDHMVDGKCVVYDHRVLDQATKAAQARLCP